VKSVVEPLNPTRVRLVVEVPFEELKPSLDSAYRRIAGQVVVPGFRKGRIPPRIIDQRIGRGAVLEEAVNEALPRLYTDAVTEANVSPLGSPEVDVTELTDGADLKFTAEVDVRPAIELPEWRELQVEVSPAEVTDEDVDGELQSLRERFGSLASVERPAADGDFVVIDLTAHRDGEPVDGAQATGLTYRVGAGDVIDGLDDAVTGLSAGESTAFSSTLLGDHAGEEVDVDVTVSAVKEQELPELDDEFAQMASEFDTLEELSESVREQAARGKRMMQALEARDKALEALLSMVEVPLPEKFIEAQVNDHFANGDHGEEDHRAEVEADVRKGLTTQLVLDEIVKREQLSPSQEELTQYIVQRASQARVDPNAFAQQVVDAGNVPMLLAEVARAKALAAVVEGARVVDTAGEVVPLDRLREDGTFADEDEDEGVHPVEAAIDADASGAEAADAETSDAEASDAEAEKDPAAS